jgi:hypothetical protein
MIKMVLVERYSGDNKIAAKQDVLEQPFWRGTFWRRTFWRDHKWDSVCKIFAFLGQYSAQYRSKSIADIASDRFYVSNECRF